VKSKLRCESCDRLLPDNWLDTHDDLICSRCTQGMSSFVMACEHLYTPWRTVGVLAQEDNPDFVAAQAWQRICKLCGHHDRAMGPVNVRPPELGEEWEAEEEMRFFSDPYLKTERHR